MANLGFTGRECKGNLLVGVNTGVAWQSWLFFFLTIFWLTGGGIHDANFVPDKWIYSRNGPQTRCVGLVGIGT